MRDNLTATLYVVATPIGNLEDMTHRAVRILNEVDVVLCEDTRTTKKLLTHYGIDTATLSYHARSGHAKTEKVLALLADGKNCALVSDAGTPTISDPGSALVAAVIERFGEAVAIVPVPGASALAAALSASGAPASEFLFLGFLPHKKGRETLFAEIATAKRTVVFYESPHRITKTLHSLDEHLGERTVTLAREITKYFEEIRSGTAAEHLVHLDAHPESGRGEFVVIVHP